MTVHDPSGLIKDQLASSLLKDVCSWYQMTDQAKQKEISLLTLDSYLWKSPQVFLEARGSSGRRLTWRTSLSKTENAPLRRKAWLLREPKGAEKPPNVNRTDRFGLLSTGLWCGFKGSFMGGLCIHSCILVSWGVNPFSYHWQPSQGKRFNAPVSGVRAKEDQRVSKPVTHGGTSANTLHKLLWQRGVVRSDGRMTCPDGVFVSTFIIYAWHLKTYTDKPSSTSM